MAPTAAQISQLRRMTNEPTEATYTDVILTAYIVRFPLPDENGEEPHIPIADSTRTITPTPGAYADVLDLVDNPDWIETYDLNAAAAEIWQEKAGVVAVDYAFSADGGNYSRNQVYEQYIKQAKYYGARRSPRLIRLKPQPHRRQDGGLQ